MAVYIPLTRNLAALVDDADAERLSQHKWHALKRGEIYYAARTVAGKAVLMHREVLSDVDGQHVDHIDGNGLNNQRANLRACSNAENLWNSGKQRRKTTSTFKGVRKSHNKWRVQIRQNGEVLDLGTFDDEIRAARQYDRAARALFGKFAKTNEMLGLLG